MLTLTVKEYVGGDVRLLWSDGKRQKLEECLNNFIVGLVRAAVAKRSWRIECERQERERQARQLEWIEQEERRRKEAAQLQALLQETDNWSKSNLIREYTRAVREDAIRRHGKIDLGSELDRWIEWANQQADRLDPLVDSQT
jgi:predicted Holliday junction resolvase-like endonuclease